MCCNLPGEVPQRDTLQAAFRLVKNHEAVVKFSLRGPGTPGQPPVSAPLADPNALAAMEYLDAADAGAFLRDSSLISLSYFLTLSAPLQHLPDRSHVRNMPRVRQLHRMTEC